jgi:hypothetical protein
METWEVKPASSPDQTRTFQHGKVGVCTIESHTIGRIELEPGWRWSTSVKPIVGTETCRTAHIGYVVQGQLGVRMEDGSEFQLKSGDTYRIDPGHDAWVEGNDLYVAVEFESLKDYAKPR